jgi:hypothetical protein
MSFQRLSRFSLALFLSWSSTATTSVLAVTEERLLSLITELKGDDLRLIRWNAVEHTAEKQASGSCSELAAATGVLKDGAATALHKKLAAEYATFCITDNPAHRALFSDQDGVHKAVVDLVESEDPAASAKAAHLIYIASYSNAKNHETFQKEGAVKSLAKIILDENSSKSLFWKGDETFDFKIYTSSHCCCIVWPINHTHSMPISRIPFLLYSAQPSHVGCCCLAEHGRFVLRNRRRWRLLLVLE